MNERDEYFKNLPVLRLTCGEFKKLSEYSATMPTGTTPGKMWRRLDGDFDRAFKAAGGQPRWMIGQYDPDCPADADSIRILWFRPILTMRADVPHVKLTKAMWVPARYGSVDRKLRQDIIDWIEERRIKLFRLDLDQINFHRQDDAFEFRMRWS